MKLNVEEAVSRAVSEAPPRKFSESVDLAINLQNIDMSQPGNRIDADIILPHGRGRQAKIAVFAAGETALLAKRAGADLIVPPEEIKALGENKRQARKLADEFDFFIAETQFMANIGKNLGPILGKRGKMPTPLPPTGDVTAMINRLKNIVKLRSRDRLTFHLNIGRKDMDIKQLADNVDAVVTKLEQSLKDGKQNLKSVYVKTTMGPAVKVI
jgi:large subunit ribosomal protein L1